MEVKYTTSEEMRNVVLSDETKIFLVAHRMVEEAVSMVDSCMEGYLGNDRKEMENLWDRVSELQDKILNLMKNVIRVALTDSEVTEI